MSELLVGPSGARARPGSRVLASTALLIAALMIVPLNVMSPGLPGGASIGPEPSIATHPLATHPIVAQPIGSPFVPSAVRPSPFVPRPAANGPVELANWSQVSVVASNPTDPANLVAAGELEAPGVSNPGTDPFPNGTLGAFTSLDGGTTWRSQLLPGSPEWSDPASPECGSAHGTALALAFGAGRSVYYLDSTTASTAVRSCQWPAPATAVYVTPSGDGGVIWGAPELVLREPVSPASDPFRSVRLVADPVTGGLSVVYLDVVNGSVDLTNSTDGGSTWSAPLALAGLPATNVTLQVGREAAGDLDLLYLQTAGSGGAIHEWLNFSRWSPATGVSAPRVLASGAGGTQGSIEIGGPVFTSDAGSGTTFAGRLYAFWTQLTL
ncbi:MAG TPA: hypothetical protein VIZ68_00500, partial [Thermoplasmata archaeon]